MPDTSAGPPPIRIPLDDRDQLGEGPVFDDRTGELLWVDITAGAVHRWSPETGARSVLRFATDAAAVILTEQADTIVVALAGELRLCGPSGERTLARLDTNDGNLRFNDCRSDPWGRLFAGAMAKDRRPGATALHRLDADGVVRVVVDQVTISNGIGWSPSGDRMYYVDSPTQRIDVFDYDGATGTPTARRPWVTIDDEDGTPDGLAVDAEGAVWICLYKGGRLRRYASDGSLDVEIRLPVTNPTCPPFAGPGLGTLYVTSARHRLTDAQLAAEPEAGALLELEPGVGGLPANRVVL